MEEKIFNLIDKLGSDERNILKDALSRQIEKFFDNQNNLTIVNDEQEKSFNLLASSLRKLARNPESTPNNGIAYYGKPAWLSTNLLSDLINEGELRRNEPLEQIDHFLGCGGNIADKLASSDELLNFVTNILGPVKSTGIASYIYYDRVGLGIRPHVDTDVFSINLMLMLKHEPPTNNFPSATVVFPPFQTPESYRLKIGEVMIMYGSSVIHTRTPIHENEVVHLLTIGFNPIREN